MKRLLQCLPFALLSMGAPILVAQAQGPVLDPSFAIINTSPTATPAIKNIALQPDGKIIVGGYLGVLNGVPVNRVCRLLPNGQVDATYNMPPIDSYINDVALQADGKLVIGGAFTTVGGQVRFGLARLLPDGTLDTGFVPPLGRVPAYASAVGKIVLQPGVGVIISGDLALPAALNVTPGTRVVRLNEATGAFDPTFPANLAFADIRDVLPQPNGNLVFASAPRLIGGRGCNVWGTLPDGTPDPAFVPLPAYVEATELVRDPATGNIYVTQGTRGTGLDSEPVRLLPNGTRDPTFNTAGAFVQGAPLTGPPTPGRFYRGQATSLAVQPNGRLLLGGDFALGGGNYAGSWRLLPSGARDLSYQPANGPSGGNGVRKVLIQPDGALLFAGNFTQAGGFALNCLARMLDSNVLAISKQQAEASLATWPVPAHDALHLRLPAAHHPQQVALLDALGRMVLRQTVDGGQTLLALPVAGLRPGAYLLRVNYAEGAPAHRRVVVE